jgi:hypothetical protein
LDVIEQVNRETPLNGLVWLFDHAETVSDENLRRIKALGGGVAIQHRMAYQGENFIRRYGKKAAASAPPVKKMLELGIPVALGTDGTRVASYNPWVALHWITSGKTIGGTQVMQKENTLDRTTALKLFTVNGYTLIKEAGKGKIQAGFSADLAVLDRDYFSIPEAQIPEIKALLTIVDGKFVYGKASFQGFAPKPLPVIPAWSPVVFYSGYQH